MMENGFIRLPIEPNIKNLHIMLLSTIVNIINEKFKKYMINL